MPLTTTNKLVTKVCGGQNGGHKIEFFWLSRGLTPSQDCEEKSTTNL